MLLLLFIACGIPVYHCETPWSAHVAQDSPFVHQDGTRIVDPAGASLPFDGVNLGGWLMWEAWIWGQKINLTHLPRQSETHLLARLTELYGAEEAQAFQHDIDTGFITEDDLAAIAALGFTVVRLPFNHTVVDDPDRLLVLDAILDAATTQGLGVVLDLHAAPGGQADLFTADPDDTLLWDDPAAQVETVALWRTLARRYALHPAVVGYDLLNEPDPPDPQDWLDLLAQLIPAVRVEDPDHMLIVEGSGLSRDFRDFTGRLDENLAWQAHIYPSLDTRAIRRIEGFAELQSCTATPVWIGEMGEDSASDVEKVRRGVEEAGLAGIAFWPWKKAPNGVNPGLAEIDAPADWDLLMEDLLAKEGKEGRLSLARAQAARADFLAAAATPRMNEEMLAALRSE